MRSEDLIGAATNKPTEPVTLDQEPCPDPPKGQRCPLCGGAYVCLQSHRRKVQKPEGPDNVKFKVMP